MQTRSMAKQTEDSENTEVLDVSEEEEEDKEISLADLLKSINQQGNRLKKMQAQSQVQFEQVKIDIREHSQTQIGELKQQLDHQSQRQFSELQQQLNTTAGELSSDIRRVRDDMLGEIQKTSEEQGQAIHQVRCELGLVIDDVKKVSNDIHDLTRADYEIHQRITVLEGRTVRDLQHLDDRMRVVEHCVASEVLPMRQISETHVKQESAPINLIDLTAENSKKQHGLSTSMNITNLDSNVQEFTPRANSGDGFGQQLREPMRKKPQEFDGKVSWEAYQVQFEMLADANGWEPDQRAAQLATSLKGAAMEILSQLSSTERQNYQLLVAALNRRYGTEHQNEVYRARFRTRTRNKGETLQELAQDLANVAHKAYPSANADLLKILLRDQFIDALDNANLKIQVKQAQPANLQEALARALEFESYVKTSSDSFKTGGGSGFKAHKGEVTDGEKFTGNCYYCKKPGHKIFECRKKKRDQEKFKDKSEKDNNEPYKYKKYDHTSTAKPQTAEKGTGTGN